MDNVHINIFLVVKGKIVRKLSLTNADTNMRKMITLFLLMIYLLGINSILVYTIKLLIISKLWYLYLDP